jgi:hypothetical protein
MLLLYYILIIEFLSITKGREDKCLGFESYTRKGGIRTQTTMMILVDQIVGATTDFVTHVAYRSALALL